tara:strand:+ start:49 stop:624 length:576 start_codon:yes stop_codon:yes gene_type:complete
MEKKEIDLIIQSRRAIYPKQFTGEKLSKNIIKRILENGNMAPSHKLTQPWIFKIFQGKSKIKLANEMIKSYNEFSHNNKVLISKADKILKNCTQSDCIIVICMKRDKKKSIPEWEELASTSMAVQNMWLSCVSYKIGCYWSTPNYSIKMSKFLGLKKNEKCLGFFYMGKFDHKSQKKTKRDSITEKIEWFN